ncbi:MAG: hypothetical protein MI757_12730 [Pirellulales bacterium]|nr:hypothetical protein [Pirellulales bacterium]
MLLRFSTAVTLLAISATLAQAQVDGWRAPGDRPRVSDNEPNTFVEPKVTPAPIKDTAKPAADGTISVIKRTKTESQPVARVASNETPAKLRPIAKVAAREPIARVTKGIGTLPNEHGQVWRDYDITPFTNRLSSVKRPQQAIVDWVLRETGHEAWHGDAVAVLSANDRRLRAYHTPAIQEIVSRTVDRFVNGKSESHAFSIRVATLTNPNWRTKIHKLLTPVAAETQGVEAWLISRENAALVLASLKRRSDYREYSSPQTIVQNGMASTLSVVTPRNYIRGIQPSAGAWPGFEQRLGTVKEGYSLEFSPLLSIDGKTVDAVVKYEIDQVEKLYNVGVEVPSPVATRQKAEIQVPQIASWKLQERFTWPIDKVLLISGGIVAKPVAAQEGSIRIPLVSSPPRADCLVFIESKGEVARAASGVKTAQQPAKAYHGRY